VGLHRAAHAEGWANRRLPLVLVVVATALYALCWFAMGVWRYEVFRASVDDGAFTQILVSAFSSFSSANEPVNHFVVHFSPIFYLLAPGVIAAHSTLVLTAYQALAGALVAPPLFFIARKRMPEWPAAACAVVALLYPPLTGVTFSDFYESGLEPAAIAWLIWAIDAGALKRALIIGILALCIKEDVAPGIVFGGLTAGLWLARRGEGGRARIAFWLAGIAALVLIGYFGVLRPLLHAPNSIWDLHFYQGGTRATLGPLDPLRLRFLWSILYPLAGLPLLTPAIVLAVPGLLEVMLSNDPITMSLETHYGGVWIGYMLVAFVFGAAKLRAIRPKLAVLALLCAAGASSYAVISLDPAARWYYLYRPPDAHDAAEQALIDSLPRDADVGGDEQIFAHLGFYPNASVGIDHRYVIVDTAQRDLSPVWQPKQRALEASVRAGRYRVVRSADGVILYERSVDVK
jgi:uncharacterized membrane protein